mgnify:CR=1 FL=1
MFFRVAERENGPTACANALKNCLTKTKRKKKRNEGTGITMLHRYASGFGLLNYCMNSVIGAFNH